MEIKKRLFLGNLPEGIVDADIRSKFSRFGTISSIEIKIKKVNDGKESSTFGFVELSLSEVQLNECLRATNGSDMKGLRMRVQVAKESFLSRLKAEREQSNSKKPPAAPAPPVADYNPLQLLKNFHKPQQADVTVPSSKPFKVNPRIEELPSRIKKFDELDSFPAAAPEEEPEEGVNLMSKLEKFSGMWNDLDEAPVLVETKREESVGAVTMLPPKPVEDPEEAKKKELDNQKRIQSLQQRNEALKAQHSLIKSALSLSSEGKNNRKIKFDEVEQSDQVEKMDSSVSKKSKKKQLFDEDELMEELNDRDDHFKQRPHLDGSSGKELLELQSRYGSDSRFKLDHRFAEKEENHIVDAENEENNEEEKQRQMSILSSLVPMAPSSNFSSMDSAKNRLGSKAFVRFDPNVKDHVKFEKTVEKLSVKDAKLKKNRSEVEEHQPDLPEVSTERYYKTTSALDIGTSSGFSLRTLFQSQSHQEEEEFVPEPVAKVASHLFQPKVVITETKEGQTGYWKNTGMWHEPLFLQTDDARFKEAVDFIQRKVQEEAYLDREKWSEYRDRLKYFYRNKMRRHTTWASGVVPHQQQQQQQATKRHSYGMDLLEQQPDMLDESSYNFYQNPSDVNGNAQKKKSHRTFYK